MVGRFFGLNGGPWLKGESAGVKKKIKRGFSTAGYKRHACCIHSGGWTQNKK